MKVSLCLLAMAVMHVQGRDSAYDFAAMAGDAVMSGDLSSLLPRIGSFVWKHQLNTKNVDTFALEALRRWAIRVAQDKEGTGFKMLMDQSDSGNFDKVFQIPAIPEYEVLLDHQWIAELKSRGGEETVLKDLAENCGLKKDELVHRLADKHGDMNARLQGVNEDVKSTQVKQLAGALTVAHFWFLKGQINAVHQSGAEIKGLVEDLEIFETEYLKNKKRLVQFFTDEEVLKMANVRLKRFEARVVEEFSRNKWIQATALVSGGISLAQMARAGYALAKTESCRSFPPSWKCAPDGTILVANLFLAYQSGNLWAEAAKNVEHAKEIYETLTATARDVQSNYCPDQSEDQLQCHVKQESELPDWWRLLADASGSIMPNFLLA